MLDGGEDGKCWEIFPVEVKVVREMLGNISPGPILFPGKYQNFLNRNVFPGKYQNFPQLNRFPGALLIASGNNWKYFPFHAE